MKIICTRIWWFQTRHQDKMHTLLTRVPSIVELNTCSPFLCSCQPNGRTTGLCTCALWRTLFRTYILTWTFCQRSASYQPPKQGFSHISKWHITKLQHGKLLGCPLQLLVLSHCIVSGVITENCCNHTRTFG